MTDIPRAPRQPEPTGNLDSTNGEAVMELLSELHRDGTTIVMVTHDPRHARHADRDVPSYGQVVADPPAALRPGS